MGVGYNGQVCVLCPRSELRDRLWHCILTRTYFHEYEQGRGMGRYGYGEEWVGMCSMSSS